MKIPATNNRYTEIIMLSRPPELDFKDQKMKQFYILNKIQFVLIKLLVHGGLPSYRRSLRTSKANFVHYFPFLKAFLAFVDPDPDPQRQKFRIHEKRIYACLAEFIQDEFADRVCHLLVDAEVRQGDIGT
jgi:hypothetical protein